MKISISYPSLDDSPGVPLLAQNRQFQWFDNPTYIYPIVPATAATLLKRAGFDVFWDDGIAEGLDYATWLRRLRSERPDVVAIETKTPVVKRHWEIIRELKGCASGGWNPVVVLMGDHVTALPAESMDKSPVDFVLTGGDYDLLLASLAGHLTGGAAALEPGIWFRDHGAVRSTGRFTLDHDIKGLPRIDRDLTRWELYSRRNGNFKRLPGTYIMAGRDCWWGRCSFCSWTTLYPKFRVRTPEDVLDEVGELIESYGVREIMDDTGSFPTGGWLREFCRGMIGRGYNRKVILDCNMRFGALKAADYALMKKAGFRLLLFGLESASQATLDRLDKGIELAGVDESLQYARSAGLYPHITIMFGYPWETCDEAMETIKYGRRLLKKGLAWTVQATVVIPYPGTPLYEYCRRKGLLKTGDWDAYDMRGAVMDAPHDAGDMQGMVRKIYSTAFSPEFIARRFLAMRDLDDLRYLLRASTKVLGHLTDFKARGKGARG
ncbi:MAG: B12-binding domain-containing radical SAM protein [Thermodesulfobacteriota bacterium]